MAGVSQKSIQNRIRSLKGTRQLTKAMETLAGTKLRKAQNQLASARGYTQAVDKAMAMLLHTRRQIPSVRRKTQPQARAVYVVFSGDRGLAGGYYNNLFKQVLQTFAPDRGAVLPVGKKAAEFFRIKGIDLYDIEYPMAEKLSAEACFEMGEMLAEKFFAGELTAVYVVYTEFVSVLSQIPKVCRGLPPEGAHFEIDASGSCGVLLEPEGEELSARIFSEYLGGLLYGALCESRASEQAARRVAMDTATKNADEMIGSLRLQYNRARQAGITQEITQIIAGN